MSSEVKRLISQAEQMEEDIKEEMIRIQCEIDNIPLGEELGNRDCQNMDAVESLDAALESIKDAKSYLKDAITF